MLRKIPIAILSAVIFSTIFTTITRANESKDNTAITRLQMRDKVILIKNEPDGIRYSVKSENGVVLSANISEAEFATKYPGLYENVRPAIAFPDGSSIKSPWAGLLPPN